MSWHVLYLKPRCEKKAAEHCTRLALNHYLPLRRETKIYQRRKVAVDKPVFPGYLFTRFDRDGRLALLKTNVIVRILQPSNERELLHQLAQIRKALAVDATLGTVDALRQGRRVRIAGGPFQGVEGVIERLRGSTQVRLNVELIGQAVALDADREYLEIID